MRVGSKLKQCKSPRHVGERWLDADEFFYSSGPPCKRCRARTGQKTVLTEALAPLTRELVDRVGWRGAIERTGLPRSTLSNVLKKRFARTYKTTARAIILSLYQVRKEMRRGGIAWASTKTAERNARIERLIGY